MFSKPPAQDEAIQKLSSQDAEARTLLYERNNTICLIKSFSRKIDIKKHSIETDQPAHYYANNWVMGYEELDQPLQYYIDQKAEYEKQKSEIDERIAKYVEAKLTTQVEPGPCRNTP